MTSTVPKTKPDASVNQTKLQVLVDKMAKFAQAL